MPTRNRVIAAISLLISSVVIMLIGVALTVSIVFILVGIPLIILGIILFIMGILTLFKGLVITILKATFGFFSLFRRNKSAYSPKKPAKNQGKRPRNGKIIDVNEKDGVFGQ